MAVQAGRLWFWRVSARRMVDPEAICALLEGGDAPAQLLDLPVAEILSGLK